ncbi:glucose-1-phosphate adenylyltransferase [Paenibacillus sp. S3N08]|uniref:Glucose-1-phosphate adenylyltransferase n=2 Tax=Paenibacillus agricola TaxID=2716264 RepID=A0ABX0J4H0_9BACL|nr:glucose-1-phosphate adenylyltransferase [Paenibacillus agricola]
MLLSGGEGRRLGVLTHNKAKPAVHFGGAARMIDFALSNCKNSGIKQVGVVTQYLPEALHQHIGKGNAWLEPADQGEIALLCSTQKHVGAKGYTGTADAVYQNWNFIERYQPEHIMVLSGDHIYQMDYSQLLKHHHDTAADATIAVTPVSWTEASRFGIMNTDNKGNITEFTEKPEVPKSNLASMGIYVFKTAFIKRFLDTDAATSGSSHDFGKDVIPAMLNSGASMQAYSFKGYWKDVGTLDSLWEAHMDLLGAHPKFQCASEHWPLHTVATSKPILHKDASGLIRRSLIYDNCKIQGIIDHSVISTGAVIGMGSRIIDSVIMPGAIIGQGVTIHKAIIGEGAVIRDGVALGFANSNGVSVIGDKEVIYAKDEKLPKVYIPASKLRIEMIG